MLELVKIKKDYVLKDQEPVHALKGISINFRRNEFVAILGHSGCGKTTLLNIIGGLDHYDSGDLIIENKSTKEYGERDWDTYRNHSIGFVFQSYNLIPHQTVIKNVELALTIGGLGKEERRKKALYALEKVGLQGLEKKKPNQMSGGQMQRVAIARALVNDPEILLADEPTGALDSETSVQIMDLLKEVAKDRLVIMVTHNPDLANQYATRIVRMKDGLLTSDSAPFDGQEEDHVRRRCPKCKTIFENQLHKCPCCGQKFKYPKKEKIKSDKKSAMSFFTATGLSVSNLISKLKRTILVSIAGSIGIIGVSAVLSVSNGVHNYINGMQDDLISQYPLSIAETSIDYTTLLTGLSNDQKREIVKFSLENEVGLDSLINYLMDKYKDFTSVKTNDINEDLLRFVEETPSKYLSALNYNYSIDVTNNIFSSWKRHDTSPQSTISLNGLTQMYISELRTVPGFGEYALFVDLFTDFMKEIPGEEEYILSQYDLVAGQYPSSWQDIAIVVDENQTLTDLIYAQMGYYTEDEFLNLARKAIEEHQENPDQSKIDYYNEHIKTAFTFDEIINKELYYLPHDSMWNYQTISKEIVEFTFDHPDYPQYGTFRFVVSYNESTTDLEGTLFVSNYEINTTFTRVSSMSDPTHPMYGDWRGSLIGLFPINFTINEDPLDASKVVVTMHDSTYGDVPVSCNKTTQDTTGYMYEGFINPDTIPEKKQMHVSCILKKKKNVQFGCLSRGVYYTKAMTAQYMSDAKNSRIVSGINSIQKHIGSSQETDKPYAAYVKYEYTSYAHGDGDKSIPDVFGYANALNTDLSSSLSSLISIRGTSNYEMDKAYLRSLSGLATKPESFEVGGISYTRYNFEPMPESISIYPKNFQAKKQVVKHLKEWNKDGDLILKATEKYPTEKTLSKEQRNELTYTDTVEMIVSIINTLINVITVALVSFTSLALVVSCFMIAVITYISTMERIKEIGVIRSLGGRKKDVSRLFIAECLITGLASGVIGVGVTYLLGGVLNLIVESASVGVTNIASLPLLTALIMVSLSVFLNVISGLIPSRYASKQDPVIALRSE